MNALYNSALRQGSSIRRDLDTLAEGAQSSPALLGQINASLTSFSRTIEDYNKLAKQELVAEKQAKAFERVKTFRTELTDYRARLEHTKREAEEAQTTQARTELLGRRPHHAATPENPYAGASTPQGRYGGHASAFGAAPADVPREAHALREQTFFQQTHTQIDEFLERGADVLAGLGQQREMLKGTQRKLYSVGNTLGISGDTIRRVERRARQDKWIFWGGVIIFFVFCYFVLRWLR
ncbi:transporter bos1 [Trichodelitschia bisporula]|uniref:Protein transport protein BOS1 n=1 Tax=Trichodelitschia bisporula TaxID=703511 RepID=A0A6G1I1I9_9PEZI|nr:transporter bos1 [Trichodelitschia bisporula]